MAQVQVFDLWIREEFPEDLLYFHSRHVTRGGDSVSTRPRLEQ